MKKLLTCVLVMLSVFSFAQTDLEKAISDLQKKLEEHNREVAVLESGIEDLKLKKIIEDINTIGLPALTSGEEVVYHSAYALCYSEKHEQAKWVVHVVIPEISTGKVSRSNDFREDSLIKTGTSTKADYWYSGFDRGHLAPSADFKWSAKALSESYFYSNMAPQRPELNRERWAALEGTIRQYVTTFNEQVFVVTGGVLKDNLPVMMNEGRVNDVSIPEKFYKVVLDYEGDEKRAIGFVMPNGRCEYPVMSYAVTVDSVEKLTGIDFFAALPDEEEARLESTLDIEGWQTGKEKGDVPPIAQKELPKKSFNTVQAKMFVGDDVTVCGTVVATKFHEKSGATFINLDKKFPNQIFSVTIWKNDLVNFDYNPVDDLMGKRICVKGEVGDYKGTPSMNLKNQKQLRFLDEDSEY